MTIQCAVGYGWNAAEFYRNRFTSLRMAPSQWSWAQRTFHPARAACTAVDSSLADQNIYAAMFALSASRMLLEKRLRQVAALIPSVS